MNHRRQLYSADWKTEASEERLDLWKRRRLGWFVIQRSVMCRFEKRECRGYGVVLGEGWDWRWGWVWWSRKGKIDGGDWAEDGRWFVMMPWKWFIVFGDCVSVWFLSFLSYDIYDCVCWFGKFTHPCQFLGSVSFIFSHHIV